MSFRRCEDIIAWQLGMQLHERVVAILSDRRISRGRKFCDQLLDASEGISANIAEGFDRYSLGQFHYFLGVAKGCLGETETRVRQGFQRRYFTEAQLNELLVLCRRTRALLTPLIVKVKHQAPTPPPKRQHQTREGARRPNRRDRKNAPDVQDPKP